MMIQIYTRTIAVIALAAAALALSGCSEQQKSDASSQVERAKKGTQTAFQNAGKQLTDDGITLKVKTAMGTSDKLDTSDVHVVTRSRVCYLKGSVVDKDQKALAERIAKDTIGKDVKLVNELQIHPPVKSAKKPH